MTVGRLLRALVLVLVVLVLLVSGGYLIVYLFRWEWNRAHTAGIFFVGAEVALVGLELHSRLRAIERRLDGGAAIDPTGAAARAITDANRGRTRSFAWLRESSGRTGVFIPVLLGAGVLLSAVAFVIERVAGAFAGPAVDAAVARRLGLALPARGLVPQVAVPERPGRAVEDERPIVVAPGRPAALAAVVLVAVLLTGGVAAGIYVLRDLTASRSEPAPDGVATVVETRIDERRTDRPIAESAESLWGACRSTVHDDVQLVGLRATGPNLVELTLLPPLGDLERKRLRGCLDDTTLDFVRAEVVGFRTIEE